ncbi:putative toxin-antitoxin system toxin component, PIN family [Nostoc sp.]|uniref:putative toxin-antitoxin system toxin component, PIN family n=1 Tax=Nostoc sp. TaxID=1180 RepID=UPI002FF7557E
MIKAVIDTSVFIAAIKSKSETSGPVKIVSTCNDGSFKIVTSPQIMEELVRKLIEYKYDSELITNFIAHIKVDAITTSGLYCTERLSNIDPKDNMILSTAYESSSDFIVTLDSKHILPIKHFCGTQIIDPSSFIREVQAAKSEVRQSIQTMIF